MKKNYKVVKAIGTHKEGDILPFYESTGNELTRKGYLAPLDGELKTDVKPKRTRTKTK